MKVTKWAMLIAMAGGLSATTASAQTNLRQPSTVMRTGFEYGSYYQASAEQPAASPSDAPAPVEAAPATAAAPGCTTGGCTTGNCAPTCEAPATCAASCGCESSCTSCQDCAMECPEGCEPWRLFSCHQDPECGPVIKGWVNAGIMGNSDSPPSRFNGPVTFYDRNGEAQLSQLYLIIEKAADPTSCDWNLGYRVDMLYGTDYRFNIARGLSAEDNFTAKWNSSRFYGLDMPQLYVELAANDWSIKIGHFYTIIGYEVVTAPDNFFMTHAYTMQYGEPFTHTGVLATKKVNDQLSLIGGLTFGWDNFEDVYDKLSFLGGATFTASDGNSKLAYAMHVGEEETVFGAINPNDTRFIQSIVYSRTITDRVNYVFQSDLGSQENALNTGDTATWYGINQYLFYKIDCCWTAGIRAEWFRDDDGFRVAPAGDYAALGASNNPASAGGFEGNFFALSAGLNYKPSDNPNLVVRPEIRWDHFDGRGVNGVAEPFDDGNSDDQFLYGVDFIYLY